MDIWIKINTNKKNTITKRDEDENNNIEYIYKIIIETNKI